MSDEPILSTEQKTTFLFVFLGVLGWYAAAQVGVGRVAQFALLIGLGVVVPTLLNERRRRENGE